MYMPNLNRSKYTIQYPPQSSNSLWMQIFSAPQQLIYTHLLTCVISFILINACNALYKWIITYMHILQQ